MSRSFAFHRAIATHETWLTAGTLLGLVSIWTLFAGKDVGWDLFNHHVYLPFSLLSGRFATDLFAAGPQSYQNPAGYLPFYLLARTALPGWVVGLGMALSQTALIVWALLHLCRTLFGDGAAQMRWRLVALVLAFVSPIFLYVVGTSSTDALCAALVLVPLALALGRSPRLPLAALAGAALGLAVAIKPTSVIYAIPILAAIGTRIWARQWPVDAALAFAAAAAAVFAVVGGWWAWWLWSRFGNPVFPLFNQLFQSPYAPVGVTAAIRFLPQTGLDWVTRVWELAQFRPFTMVEGFMPDPRPLLACAGVAAAGVVATRRKGWGLWRRRETWLRADVQLVLVSLVVYLLWMATSGNARYAIALFMLVGLVLARAVQSIWSWQRSGAMLWVLAGLQLLVYVADGERRTFPTPWDSRPYLSAHIPPRLSGQPFLHLSVGLNSYAAVVPFLHPDGALVNLTGQMSLPQDGPLGRSLQETLARWEGRTRVLLAPPVSLEGPKLKDVLAAESWALTYRMGLRIEPTGCEVIRLLPKASTTGLDGPILLSCPVTPQRRDDPQLTADLARSGQVFTAIESKCPRIFGPSPMVSDYGPEAVWRHYMNSDARVYVSPTKGVILSHFRALNPVTLGSIDHVISNGGQDACKAWKQLWKS
jgi:hypothetical protein